MRRPGCSDADAGWKMMIICQRFEAWACNFDWAARCWCGLAEPGGTTSAGGWYFEKISWLAWLWLGRWWLHTPYILLLELQSRYLPDNRHHNVVARVPGCCTWSPHYTAI